MHAVLTTQIHADSAMEAIRTWLNGTPHGCSPSQAAHLDMLGCALLAVSTDEAGSWLSCTPTMHALLWRKRCVCAAAAVSSPLITGHVSISWPASSEAP